MPYRLGLYEKSMPDELTLREKLREARLAGYDYLELSIDETDERLARLDWDAEQTAELVRAQYEEDIPIHSLCLSAHRKFPLGHPNEAVRRQSLDIMQGAIRLAQRLGARLIQLAGYDVYYDPSTLQTQADFAKNLRACVNMAAREGVVLAFETMETPFMDTVEKAMYWVYQANSPYLQAYPDIGNLTNAALLYQSDVLADLRLGHGHIAALHLKETKPTIYREVEYGEGHVNFEKAARAAMQMGVGMYVGEFWHTGQPHWRDVLRKNNRFLRNCLNFKPE